MSSDIISTDLILKSERTVKQPQFAKAATNQNEVGWNEVSEMRLVKMKSDEMRWVIWTLLRKNTDHSGGRCNVNGIDPSGMCRDLS